MDDDLNAVPQSPVPDDLVVIDRSILKQTLEAVVNTLQSTARLEQLRAKGDVDKATYIELSLQLREARDSLAEGIAHVLTSLDELPAVDLKPGD